MFFFWNNLLLRVFHLVKYYIYYDENLNVNLYPLKVFNYIQFQSYTRFFIALSRTWLGRQRKPQQPSVKTLLSLLFALFRDFKYKKNMKIIIQCWTKHGNCDSEQENEHMEGTTTCRHVKGPYTLLYSASEQCGVRRQGWVLI